MDLAKESELKACTITFKRLFVYYRVTVNLQTAFAEEKVLPSPLTIWLYKKPKKLLKSFGVLLY